jgi:hypothetical protein
MGQDQEYPRLRPVDAQPSRNHPYAVELTDRSGVAESVLTVSQPTLSILSMMTGRRRRSDIQAEFMRRHGQMLFSDDLDQLIEQLDQAHFLEGPRFEARWDDLTRQYRASGVRRVRDVGALGAPVEGLGDYLDSVLSRRSGEPRHVNTANVVGIIAPHLDYDRGAPCYAAAYRDLFSRVEAARFVILGTNHFGRGGGVVGTMNDFETPWGSVPHDADLMRRMNERCGDLCAYELDHVREHSVELQVILLKHVLGDRPFTIAPYLCPDPCGSMEGRAGDGPRRGASGLREFALALREETATDTVPTCIIAGADLSHVGRYFNGDRNLDAAYLRDIEASDRAALRHVVEGDPEGLRHRIASTSNATGICSVGCIYALATVMQGRAAPTLLHYHQAVVEKLQNCVTCAAVEYRAA